MVCNKKGYVLHFFPLFTSPGSSRERAALTCEHIIVAVDFVQLKSFIKFMELVWIQHLTLPVGIACKANIRSFFQRWIFCFRSHMILVEGPGSIFTSSPVKCCCWTVYVLNFSLAPLPPKGTGVTTLQSECLFTSKSSWAHTSSCQISHGAFATIPFLCGGEKAYITV